MRDALEIAVLDGASGDLVMRLRVPEALAAGIAAALLSLGRRKHGNGST